MNIAKRTWWEGGGSAYDSDYQAVLDRGTTLGYTLPTEANQIKQNTLVTELKAAGIWSLLDLFYVFRTDGDASFALINWKNPSSYLGLRTQLTFTASSGFKGNGSTGYIDTQFSCKNNGSNFQLNNCSIFCYVPETTTVGASIWGANDAASANLTYLVNYAGGNAQFYMESTSFGDNIATANQGGLWHGQRTAAGTSKLFKNGALLGNGTRTSNDRPTVNMYVGARNNNGSAAGAIANTTTVGLFGLGASLANLEDELDTAWDNYIA